jgi:hypothetical protein
MPERPPPEPPFHRRLAWFVSLWIAGVVAVALVGALIRLWLA